MKWISVKDRLPKSNVNVLGHEQDGTIRVYFLYDVKAHKYYGYKCPTFREYCSDNFRWTTDGITHWMPLPPKPPKK